MEPGHGFRVTAAVSAALTADGGTFRLTIQRAFALPAASLSGR
jgi:hypothetical protein